MPQKFALPTITTDLMYKYPGLPLGNLLIFQSIGGRAD